jgi:hypothetical protein
MNDDYDVCEDDGVFGREGAKSSSFNGWVKLQAREKDVIRRSYSECRQGGSVAQNQDPLMTEEKG